MSPPLPRPVLIADAPGLADLLRALAPYPVVAIDTESNSLHAYRERVCLIQFSTPALDYVLDPLRVPDLSPLAPFFANPQQQKVFHAAEYDLICLKRDYGFEFVEIFDTMVAARSLGWSQLGLGAILEERFGVKLNKKFQRADWGHRPLTFEQLDYARFDTHYLLPLRELQLQELTAANRWSEAREEFARFARMRVTPAPAPDPDAFWRVNGAKDLKPTQAAILKELFLYREQQAARIDRPPFKVMGDQTLLEIARHTPHHAEDLHGVPGMTPGQIRRHAAGILHAVQRGLAAPHPRPPHIARESDAVRDRYDLLHKWRKDKAKARGVESDVILPRDTLWALARRVPRSLADLAQIEDLGPWRRETYGEEILKVLSTNQA